MRDRRLLSRRLYYPDTASGFIRGSRPITRSSIRCFNEVVNRYAVGRGSPASRRRSRADRLRRSRDVRQSAEASASNISRAREGRQAVLHGRELHEDAQPDQCSPEFAGRTHLGDYSIRDGNWTLMSARSSMRCAPRPPNTVVILTSDNGALAGCVSRCRNEPVSRREGFPV